jgi:hypothetical protein
MAHWIYSEQTNDTCDVYRSGNSPPSPPDVAGVPVYVLPRFRNIKGNFNGLFDYTHVLYVPLGTDVRDGFSGSGAPTGADTLYVPSGAAAGMELTVQFVCRRRLSGGLPDYLEVYAKATSWNYPTQEG